MKKFEILGKRLSKNDQKQIPGGVGGGGCPAGESDYCCDIELSNPEGWTTDNTCATSSFYAKAHMYQKYLNNCLTANCQLA